MMPVSSQPASLTPDPQPLRHGNGFGFLRLFFAALVIVSHTPEMADGNRSRELLTRAFGTISFGELAVDAFFLISGYLICASYLAHGNALIYLKRRIARIYPAFIAASLVSLMIVAPLAGASLQVLFQQAGASAQALLLLQMPLAPGVFAGTQFAVLNAPMWTISFEFRCYMLVLVLGLAGAFKRPWLVAVMAAAMLASFEIYSATALRGVAQHVPGHGLLFDDLPATLRLSGIFLIGALFYLYRQKIIYTPRRALLAALLLIPCLLVPWLAEPALALLGGYAIFALACLSTTGPLSRINDGDDISYGVYLYAWPIGKLLLWYWPAMPLVLCATLTFIGACLCGWLSWHCVEKRVMAWTNRKLRRHGTA